MTRANAAIVNMAGGELSPLVDARTELKIFKQSASRIQNFIVLPQGPVTYRPGTAHVHTTRRNNNGVFIPFQFNDEQSYLIEATEQYFRFYRNNAIIVEDSNAITGATQANPVVITSATHGYSDGDEVFINDVVGMTELNGKAYLVANSTTNTFELTDQDGNNIDGTAYTAYTSGGIAERIYEIQTPYQEADLRTLQYTQNADTMYIAHRNYEPRKLTRSGNTNWSLARYSRTNDPFRASQNITGITQANPAVVTYSGADNFANGDQIFIDEVVGMTEVNNKHYLVANVNTAANTFELTDLSGNNIDSTAYTAYGSAGQVEEIGGDAEYPRACVFTDDARLLFGGTVSKPETFWASRGPNSGTPRYDDFTTGSNDTDAVTFTLAPVHGQVDAIQWLANSDKFILAGTFGTVRRIYGATEQEPITPSSITAKSVNTFGCALSLPVSNGVNVFYIQRGDDKLRSFEFDYVIDGYLTTDRNLISNHITQSGFKQIANQLSNYNAIWAVRNDGVLTGMTYNDKEDISGWHRQYFAGTHKDDNSIDRAYGRVLHVGSMPRPNNEEQLWAIVERQINGQTRRYVEYLTDLVTFPEPEDFYTAQTAQTADSALLRDALYQKVKNCVHVDSSLTYNGSATGTAAAATVTPAAVSGDSVVFTASTSVFTSDMVGREIWKGYDETGNGGGRAEITGYTSGTQVTCEIKSNFDNVNAIPAGSWYLTASSFSGLDHLEGETVQVVGDGAVQNTKTVTNGAITLDSPVAICHVGLGYTGIIKSLNLDIGGVTGTAQSKMRNVSEVVLRFLNSVGALFGTSLYDMERLVFRSTADTTSRGVPLFSGNKTQVYEDGWEREKHVFVMQDRPLPCTIQSIDVFTETTDE